MKQKCCAPGSPDVELIIEPSKGDLVLDKVGKYGLTPAHVRQLKRRGIRCVTVCGLDTDACVLGVMFSLFDAGIECHADLKSYFDTIPKERLMSRLEERIADSRLLALLRGYLDQEVMEELVRHEPTERGTPQGAVISPLLANIYLDPLDHLLAAAGVQMVRYADDFVLLCRSEEEAQSALARVQTWVQEQGLTLHPEKTRIVDVTQPGGFDFLGYHFERGYRWPRRKALDRLKEKVRQLTPRTSGVGYRWRPPSCSSTKCCVDGTATSNTATARPFPVWTVTSAAVSVPSCANAPESGAGAAGPTTTDGATTTSAKWVCSV